VARNRKRAKERRSRRPPAAPGAQPGVATARAARDEAPDPIEHASPDVELAEAQMALGRPELVEDEDLEADAIREEEEEDEELREEEFGEPAPAVPGVLPERPHVERGEVVEVGAEVAQVGPAEAEPGIRRGGNRIINFLQGSWRELQRVQWPDRRQVMQATGVVIGFVIVAGVFLGVADFLAGKLVNYILK